MRYYGCKTKLLDYISDVVASLPVKKGATFFDIFSGTAAVGKHFKKLDYTVYSNDFLEFAHAFARCYIETNSKPRFANLKINEDVIVYLNDLKGKVGFITKNYSPYGKKVPPYISGCFLNHPSAINSRKK